ncbi:MAG: cellulase family glycosylhydrolase [Ramlibacter sp.]|nr:cellulase family glycosylhydrolase [Ramlibacter sp.]
MQKYINDAQDALGNALAGASVLIKKQDGTNASLYSTNGSGSPKVNPIITGQDGDFSFYAPNGRYSIEISQAGFVGKTIPDVLLFDPAEPYAASIEDIEQTLIDAPTIAWDMSLGADAKVTLTTSRTLGAPTNVKFGTHYLAVTQPSGGNALLTLDPVYVNLPADPLSTGGGKTDVFLVVAMPSGVHLKMISKGGAFVSPPPPPPPPPPPAPPAPPSVAIGTNLSGMEWARPGIRYGTSTRQNMHWTPPRASDVTWLAGQGMKKNRLPIQWELAQPILTGSPANAAVIAAHDIAAAGDLKESYMVIIEGILAAHAAVGMTCIIDLHNYFRYQDFVFEADGSVIGFTNPADPLYPPYTTNNTKVIERIASKAAGATMTQAHFVSIWQKLVTRLKDKPGLGGWGLMNEPHDLPAVGGTTGYGSPEDGTITPTFHQAAINAIRAIDTATPIYVSFNNWDAAFSVANTTTNPGYPLTGANLIYEVHMYLDASSSGGNFDYDIEVAKNFSAGLVPDNVPIGPLTARDRLKFAVDWAAAQVPPVKLALTEVGMPVDDVRWQTMFKNAADYAYLNGCEIYTWMGGNHWPINDYAINHVPNWYQNKTVAPLVEAALRSNAGLSTATVFDAGDGWSSGGSAVTITVFARGSLSAAITLTVASNNGGTFSKTTLTLNPGLNPFDTFTFTPAANLVTTLTYTRGDGGGVPPARKVYSLTDPVAYAGTSLPEAAAAIMAKYKAARYLASDAWTDYMGGVAAAASGNVVRAISDSGWATKHTNIHGMKNWWNKESWMQTPDDILLPVIGIANAKPYINKDPYNTFGLWSKKTKPDNNGANSQPNPNDLALYNMEDSHFQIVAASCANDFTNGIVFESSQAEDYFRANLRIVNAVPQMEFVDGAYTTTNVSSSGGAIAVNTPTVISMTSAPGSQKLRVNRVERGTAALTHAAGKFNQHLIGMGYYGYYPREPLMGRIWGAVHGKGTPSTAEIDVLEQYMQTLY